MRVLGISLNSELNLTPRKASDPVPVLLLHVFRLCYSSHFPSSDLFPIEKPARVVRSSTGGELRP